MKDLQGGVSATVIPSRESANDSCYEHDDDDDWDHRLLDPHHLSHQLNRLKKYLIV